jgi:DNA-binding NarL/FixJ family response regulator
MLERFGICTIVAHGSEAADELLAASDDHFDLVFAEIGGAHDCCAELLARLRAECPQVKVVCVTPYNTDLGPEHQLRLMKPFTPEDVMTVVVYAMGGPATARPYSTP